MRQIAIVGHSHSAALRDALKKDKATRKLFAGIEVGYVSLGGPEFNGQKGRGSVLNAPFRAVLLPYGPEDLLVLAVAGNAHNILGLLNFQPRFDFVLPEEPDLPLDAGARILPAGLVRNSVEKRSHSHVTALKRIAFVSRARKVQIESPAPIPSADHIAKYPGVFKDLIRERGVAPAALRYKLWRLYSAIVKLRCDEMGIAFLPVPEETQDSAGMLREDYWNPDPTHGNWCYGAAVMAQVHRLLQEQAHAQAQPEAAPV